MAPAGGLGDWAGFARGVIEIAKAGIGIGLEDPGMREVIAAAEALTGRVISWRATTRRPGDPPVLVANPSLAAELLGWRARLSDLTTIIQTSLAWHKILLDNCGRHLADCEGCPRDRSDVDRYHPDTPGRPRRETLTAVDD